MLTQKALDLLNRSLFADPVSYIDGKKIRIDNKVINRLAPDMVCVHMIRQSPAQRRHRGISGCPCRLRFRADNRVLAMRLVPNWDHLDSALGGLHARAQLRHGLAPK